MAGRDLKKKKIQDIISEYKKNGREKEIQSTIKNINKENTKLNCPKEFCYLDGEMRDRYLHDMKICQEYAVMNRRMIAKQIMEHMHWIIRDSFESVHNYIDHDSNIVRKGAISARKNERVIIPLNMRDGCIIGTGKGNEDWNFSAPHGAGRLLSRSAAKQKLSIHTFSESMKGIYTTCVNESTLDESPMAYKDWKEIADSIGDTVQIEKIIKPIYNFKASD